MIFNRLKDLSIFCEHCIISLRRSSSVALLSTTYFAGLLNVPFVQEFLSTGNKSVLFGGFFQAISLFFLECSTALRKIDMAGDGPCVSEVSLVQSGESQVE